MKRFISKSISLALTLCIIFTLLPTAALAAGESFTDTAGHWAGDAIEKWAAYDVFRGSEGEGRPDDPITRAELAALLVRVIGYSELSAAAFKDVPSGAWYYADISKLCAAGIMEGDGAGIMRPEDKITREEAAVLIARAFDVPENSEHASPFPDSPEISGWARSFVEAMKGRGYVSGNSAGYFNPKANITRAEVAVILDNIIEVYLTGGGERDCERIGEIDGNALVNTAGTHVKNLAAKANFYLTEGIGSGDATLENVAVGGTLFIRGGGPSSIYLIGGSYNVIRLGGRTNPHLNISRETVVIGIHFTGFASVTLGGLTIVYDAASGKVTFSGDTSGVRKNADGTATVTVGGVTINITLPGGTVTEIVPPVYAAPASYTLTYDANGGDGEVPDEFTGSSTTVAASTGMSAPGKTFYGWNTETDGSGKFYFSGDNISLTANLTLYAYWTGGGSADTDPIEITGASGLQAMNGGLSKHYKLMADIEVDDWVPVGNGSSGDDTTRFTGSLDGNGKTVTINGIGTVTATSSNYYCAGLFGVISYGGSVKNLTVDGTVSFEQDGANNVYVGGVAGWMYSGSITGCAVDVEITASGGSRNCAGGIAGNMGTGSSISNCYATGKVTASGSGYAGGIAGSAGSVTACWASGTVESGNCAGGIAGRAGGSSVTNCVALNSSVMGGSVNTGRVEGDVSGGTLSDNYGLVTMTDGPWINNTADGKDGADITEEQAETEIWWSGGVFASYWGDGTETNKVWQWDSVKERPILYWQS